MPWPAPDEFNEAVQNPKLNINDRELQSAFPACNALGLPIVSSGAFASVYRFRTERKDFAVRCFLRELSDRATRYDAISKFILKDSLPATVDFEFIDRGILVRGRWYPILKMEWVEGQLLNHYVEQHIEEPKKLLQLAESFREMVLSLAQEGLAHGDLQHGNILICNDQFRLVDYDGMFVPTLAGLESDELGHPNYQHPQRSKRDFSPSLDNFAAWIIYITLRCLAQDPTLWKTLRGGDERLLLGRQDFASPSKSSTLGHLLTHHDPEIRGYAEIIIALLSLHPDSIPGLDNEAGLRKPSLARMLRNFGLRTRATFQSIRINGKPPSQGVIETSIELPPKVPKKIAVPKDADWFAMSTRQREEFALNFGTTDLLHFFEINSPKNYAVAARIAAIKCSHDETDALTFTRLFAELIYDLEAKDANLLPHLQDCYETIFLNCLNAAKRPRRTGLTSTYLKALSALLRHQCQVGSVNFESFLEIIVHVEYALITVEDYLVLTFRSTPNKMLRQELIPVLIQLLECYEEKLARTHRDRLKSKFEVELHSAISLKHQPRQIRRLAEETLLLLNSQSESPWWTVAGETTDQHGKRQHPGVTLPSIGRWRSSSSAVKQELTSAVPSASLARVITIRNVVSLEMAAIKCGSSHEEARVLLALLADVIGHVNKDTVYSLPPGLLAFENALFQSMKYCGAKREVPEWVMKSYFKVLNVILSNLAQKTTCDLERFLLTWFEFPATPGFPASYPDLELRLLAMLRRREGDTSREAVIRGLGYLLDCYTERNLGSVRNWLSSEVVLVLQKIIADRKETQHMKRTAQQALSKFSVVQP